MASWFCVKAEMFPDGAAEAMLLKVTYIVIILTKTEGFCTVYTCLLVQKHTFLLQVNEI